jgi:hypothetical protein
LNASDACEALSKDANRVPHLARRKYDQRRVGVENGVPPVSLSKL